MKQQLTKIADRVWIWPYCDDADHVQSTVGVIIGRNETVLVDAGNGPAVARRIRMALDALEAPPITRIIYTHHHWDHVFGAYVFGAPVIAHELCHAFLAEMRQKAWDAELLRAHERNPNLKIDYTAVDWDEFRLIMPDIVFSQEKVIDLDGVTLQLSHVGGDHAADSIVVKVVESGVMFLGDCYYPRNHTSDPISTSMLDSLVDDAYELYIDGHREPFSRARIERIVRLYKYLPRSR